jgi:hypothetical protein
VTVRDLLTLAVIACAIWVDRHSRRRDARADAHMEIAEAFFADAEARYAAALAIREEFTQEETTT